MKRTTSGFTLIEVVTTLALLGVTLAAASETLVGTVRSQSSVSLRGVLDDQMRRLQNNVESLLEPAGLQTLLEIPLAPATSRSIRFRTMLGYDATSGPQWGNALRLTFRAAPGEELNGDDDNGDGRVDEGSLVLSDGVDTRVLGRNLTQSDWSLDGRCVRVTFTMETRDSRGDRIRITRSSDVLLRN
ncbi:MAG: prepilin-type N-terminal cleavage/methylation domain-containing protein [Planctomycetota bacterium]